MPTPLRELLAIARSRQAPNLSTGIDDLDAVTGGLAPGSLWLVVGAHGSGRSMLALQFAEHAARAGGKTVMITLRDGPLETTRRLDAYSSFRRLPVDDLPLTLLSSADVPHAWMIGYPRERDAPEELSLTVVDDIDLYEHHDGRIPGGPDSHLSQPSALPEQLRAQAAATGLPIVVTRPTPLISDWSGREVPDVWQRAADVVLRVDSINWREPTRDPEVLREPVLVVLRNRFGPQAIVPVESMAPGFLFSPRSAW